MVVPLSHGLSTCFSVSHGFSCSQPKVSVSRANQARLTSSVLVMFCQHLMQSFFLAKIHVPGEAWNLNDHYDRSCTAYP